MKIKIITNILNFEKWRLEKKKKRLEEELKDTEERLSEIQ